MPIKWEDPDEVRPTKSSHQEEADELRAHPGQWGIVKEFPVEKVQSANAMQQQIQTGVLRAFRPVHSFISKTRTVEGTVKVYAKYEPEEIPEEGSNGQGSVHEARGSSDGRTRAAEADHDSAAEADNELEDHTAVS
jgi:hypothetical protein